MIRIVRLLFRNYFESGWKCSAVRFLTTLAKNMQVLKVEREIVFRFVTMWEVFPLQGVEC